MRVILPMYKKRDNKDCNNHIGITLLSTVWKMYKDISDKKVRAEITHILLEAHSGIRTGMSV